MGRKEINVVNFVPGLYNFIVVNNCKHKLKKKKIKWDRRALGYLFPEQAFLLKDSKLL